MTKDTHASTSTSEPKAEPTSAASVSQEKRCDFCFRPLLKQERFCGNCGAPLLHITWRLDASILTTEKNQVIVAVDQASSLPVANDPKKREIKLVVQNTGKVPCALIIPDIEDEFQLPPWVDRVSLYAQWGTPISLQVGESRTISLRFKNKELDDAWKRLQSNPEDLHAYQCSIPVYKSVVEEDPTSHKKRIKEYRTAKDTLLFSPSREPYIHPEVCIMRFLSWEHLELLAAQEEAALHTVIVNNHKNTPILIREIEIHDAEPELRGLGITFPLPKNSTQKIDYWSVREKQLFSTETENVVIGARGKHEFVVRVNKDLKELLEAWEEDVDGFSEKKRPLKRFSCKIILKASAEHKEEKGLFESETTIEIVCRLAGLVGHAPSFNTKKTKPYEKEFIIDRNSFTRGYKIACENSGHLPVQIDNIEVFRQVPQNPALRERITGRDWLIYQGLKKSSEELAEGMIIQPFSTEHFSLEIEPNNREDSEAKETHPVRYIRIHHTPCYNPQTQKISTLTELKVEAELGRIYDNDDLILAIDFGTTNSVSYLQRRSKFRMRHCVPLEPNAIGSSSKDMLPSLLFYDTAISEKDTYFTGIEAQRIGETQPENFIRSMKSIINKNRLFEMKFIKETQHGRRYVTQTAQDLLNAFILDIKQRTETEFRNIHDQLQVEQKNVRINRAIFTHPVGISKDSKYALFEASHNAGLNTHLQTYEDFSSKALIDEASAALVAFVLFLMGQGQQINGKKILCIDIGGGTTDISAATVSTRPGIKVVLEEPIGHKLGGDDIDVEIAKFWLNKAGVSEADQEHYYDVWKSRSRSDYEEEFGLKHGARLSKNDQDTQVHQNYQNAKNLLSTAEKAKKTLASGSVKESSEKVRNSTHFGSKNVLLSQEEFRKILHPSIQQIKSKIMDLLHRIKWEYEDISFLVFTGQTNWILYIQECIKKLFLSEQTQAYGPYGQNPFRPKHCVSQGAAIYSVGTGIEIVRPTDRNVITLDLWQNNIHAQFGFMPPYIAANTPLPLERDITDHHDSIFALYSKNGELFKEFVLPSGIHSFRLQINSMEDFQLEFF